MYNFKNFFFLSLARKKLNKLFQKRYLILVKAANCFFLLKKDKRVFHFNKEPVHYEGEFFLKNNPQTSTQTCTNNKL